MVKYLSFKIVNFKIFQGWRTSGKNHVPTEFMFDPGLNLIHCTFPCFGSLSANCYETIGHSNCYKRWLIISFAKVMKGTKPNTHSNGVWNQQSLQALQVVDDSHALTYGDSHHSWEMAIQMCKWWWTIIPHPQYHTIRVQNSQIETTEIKPLHHTWVHTIQNTQQ